MTGITLNHDDFDGGRIHAVKIRSADVVRQRSLDQDFYRAQEQQNFDATNAFRVNHGRSVLVWDDVAAQTSRQHSRDMADKNYFDHTALDGSEPWDRFARNGGRYYRLGENLAGGYMFGVDAFAGLVNSEGHRDNMLDRSHRYLGVGFEQNPASSYTYYLTQIFFS